MHIHVIQCLRGFPSVVWFWNMYWFCFTYVIVTPVFVILNVIELKKIEEPELIKRFGQEYMEYRDKAPMFFPRFF